MMTFKRGELWEEDDASTGGRTGVTVSLNDVRETG